MPYLVLKSCVIDNSRCNAGDILNLSDENARSLTAMGRVEYVDAPQPAKEVEDRSVALPKSKATKTFTRKSKK
tara:strand:- start:2369 stop:2587 length:219 start_codon:yes stop_codon:yes gene_type:complete